MGDPKSQRKKYVTPRHPWQKERLEAERVLMEEYGIKNKRELWKMNSLRKRFTHQVKSMIADESEQAQLEKQRLIDKLYRLGLIEAPSVDIDRVLNIQLKDILERRLQTLVYRKNLARSIDQARQFIVHGHIYLGNKKVTSPSHITTREEEAGLRFSPDSPFSQPDHPEISKETKPVATKGEEAA
ncbi:30S ribosomal protein S4 [Candidatus Woesearchaeota archaeon]|nr:30S ribosomal protein S4 [Candidatus Woesearchaeota archaeon]RLE43694.1 MAG: 30S ribosomal protein S4 [Candidatus Woesearchaeota archaeon]